MKITSTTEGWLITYVTLWGGQQSQPLTVVSDVDPVEFLTIRDRRAGHPPYAIIFAMHLPSVEWSKLSEHRVSIHNP